MLAPLPASSPGPSLPPGVNGALVGTLAICFQKCSVVDTFVRIQFWGERAFSDLHPNKSGSVLGEPRSIDAGRSTTVEYPLVGSLLAVHNYLKDASPVQVTFLRGPTRPRWPDHGADDGPLHPERVVGRASIPDVCIADTLKLQTAQYDRPETYKLSLRRELQISSLDTAPSGPDVHIGEALFELLFRVIVPPAATSPRKNESTKREEMACYQSIPEKLIVGPATIETGPAQLSGFEAYHTHSRPRALYDIQGYDNDQSVTGSSIGFHGDLDTDNSEEQSGILDELLDICNDDLTMPTIHSADSSGDPFDMWVSRIVAHASSSPAREFSSLVAVGSRRSSVLRKVGSVNLEIDQVALYSRVVNRIKGKNNFYMQYNPPPHAFEPDKASAIDELASGVVEFTVCKQVGNQNEMRSRAKPTASSTKANKGEISLLATTHSKQMQVQFKDDDSVRRWLDGTMEFSLTYCASKPIGHPKLPRVARLVGKGKESNSATNPSRVCLARAYLRLRDVILSETFSSHVKIDLVLASDAGGLGDVGMKVGSLSVHLGLHLVGESTDRSTRCSSTDFTAAAPNDGNTRIFMSETQSPSTLSPHPISVFLSNYMEDSHGHVAAMALTREKSSVSCQAGAPTCGQTPSQIESPHSDVIHRNNSENGREISAPLEPVEPPPIWLDVRVNCISDLSMDHISDKPGWLRLCLSSSDAILSSETLAHCNDNAKNAEKSLSLGPQTCSEEMVRLRTDGPNPISTKTSCSWQLALDAEREGSRTAIVTLHIWHCGDNDASPYAVGKTLVGLAKIPFSFETWNGSRQKTCAWLPSVAADGSFDVLHPKSHALIGKVQATVTAGMLRQIRSFSVACKSASKVQRWWRRTRSISKEKEEASRESHPRDDTRPENPPKQSAAQDYDPDFDTIHTGFLSKNGKATRHNVAQDHDPGFDILHAGFITQNETANQGKKDDPTTSPDSLFEEWSQQSFAIDGAPNRNKIPCEITDILPSWDCHQIQQEDPAVGSSSRVSESDEDLAAAADVNHDDDLPEAEEKSKTIDYFQTNESWTEAINPETTILEQATCNDPIIIEQSRNDELDSSTCKRFDILVRLEKISGLQEILSTWCSKHQESTLLSASGVFVSYSVSHGAPTMSQEEELRRFCLGANVWHSNVVSAETMAHDVELNLESTISIPNHEADTKMILAQTLEFKLWFAPIITTTVAAMINGNKAKEIQSLNGCTVISIANCPLYHLYTLEGYYRGRVPCSVAVYGQQKDEDHIGYITTSICRINLQNGSVSSSLTSDEEHSQNDVDQHPALSTLKPINLQASFSHGQEISMHQSTGIDPPEDKIEWSCHKATSSKRKIEQSCTSLFATSREPTAPKRHRLVDNPDALLYKDDTSKVTNPIHEDLHEQDDGGESETLCPSEASFGWDTELESEETPTCRSLTSVMKSLVNINSNLLRVKSFGEPQTETVCDDRRTSSEVDTESHVTGTDQSQCSTVLKYSKRDFSVQVSEMDCGRIEAPQANHCSETTSEYKKSVLDSVKSCEKGSSPISMTYRYTDATTSPCCESLCASINEEELSRNDDWNQQHDNRIKATRAENLDRLHPSKDDTKVQGGGYGSDESELDDDFKNDDTNPMKSKLFACLTSEKIKQRLDKKRINSSKRTMRSQDSQGHCIQSYLTSKGHLGAISKTYGSLASDPPHLRGIFESSPFQARERNTSTLSPALNSMRLSRHNIVCGEGYSTCMGTGDPNGVGAGEKTASHESREKARLISDDKDRLERIFQSTFQFKKP